MFNWRDFEGWCWLVDTTKDCCIQGLRFTKDVLYRFDYRYKNLEYDTERIIVWKGDKSVNLSPTAFEKIFQKVSMNLTT